MNWEECKNKGFVKVAYLDEELVKSLLGSSKDKFISAERLELDNVTSSSKIALYYDSLREILEALAIKKGFKIYNHECFTCFLSELCHEIDVSYDFDKFRKIRNRVNYYGKRIPLTEAELVIVGIIDMRKKLLKHYFNNSK